MVPNSSADTWPSLSASAAWWCQCQTFTLIYIKTDFVFYLETFPREPVDLLVRFRVGVANILAVFHKCVFVKLKIHIEYRISFQPKYVFVFRQMSGCFLVLPCQMLWRGIVLCSCCKQILTWAEINKFPENFKQKKMLTIHQKTQHRRHSHQWPQTGPCLGGKKNVFIILNFN